MGILREYEFGIYMDVRTAKQLVKFLTLRIEELENIKEVWDEEDDAHRESFLKD